MIRGYQAIKIDCGIGSHLENWSNLIIRESYTDVDSKIPVVISGDLKRPEVKKFMNTRQPAIYIARGYLGNHLYKKRRWWRYSVNGFANTILHTVPHSRWKMLELPKHPWKVKKVKNVLIAPSNMMEYIWDPIRGGQWPEYMMQQFPGAEVRIRHKASTPGERWSTLWQDLDWADLVVAQGSAITVEAFWYGKKVISIHPCPTWAAGKTVLEDWNNPQEPKLRNAWHEHLAWCQFTNEEWASQQALDLIKSYLGDIKDYDPGYTHNFATSI